MTSPEDEIIEVAEDEESDLPSDQPKRKKRILRHTAVLPSIFTLLNGMCGLGAIHFASKQAFGSDIGDLLIDLKTASALIFLAMICDMLDGRMARMTRTTSDFGAQLDSLCDVVSFGVAPAVMVLRCSVSVLRSIVTLPDIPVERAFWSVSAIYLSCTVLRLARFNVESDHAEESHMSFRGLPSPGAAACLASATLLFIDLMHKTEHWTWLSVDILQYITAVAMPILMLLCALLMVSRFKYQHLANQYVRGTRPFAYLVKIVFLFFLMVALFFEPYCALAVFIMGYTISGPLGSLTRLVRRTLSSG